MAQGQIQVTFHWIYLMIAGALILLFFVGIIVKQQHVAEEQLAGEVVGLLDSIFTGAGVSEKTKNVIDTSGLADFRIDFSCAHGVSTFALEGRSVAADNAIDPFFAPTYIQSPKVLTWSLPYNYPYKITDVLIVTAPTIKYYFWGGSSAVTSFSAEMENFASVGILVDVGDYQRIQPENYKHIRIIDDGNIHEGMAVPAALRGLSDEQLSAVVVAYPFVSYFQKEGNSWKALGTIEVLTLGGERDALLYGALVAGSPEMVQCNLQKVYTRMGFVTKLYLERAKELKDYYVQINPAGECSTTLGDSGGGVMGGLETVGRTLSVCQALLDACPLSDIQTLVNQLQLLNDRLRLNCIPFY